MLKSPWSHDFASPRKPTRTCGNFNGLSRPTKIWYCANVLSNALRIANIKNCTSGKSAESTRRKGIRFLRGQQTDRTGPTRHPPRNGFTLWEGAVWGGDITRVCFLGFLPSTTKLTTHTHTLSTCAGRTFPLLGRGSGVSGNSGRTKREEKANAKCLAPSSLDRVRVPQGGRKRHEHESGRDFYVFQLVFVLDS